ncbi:unnamed protein product [Paramecium primaurelia]|uniref:Uncharacterized protein n=2 Tax=Paramecium TaxID=5884 RepID=A0A8S1VRD7_9CILI|nr:unnamed protein product [Paramecium primaurelia]CAD8180478.1 unnamed protein product [Paramecium pentaurelia]
MNNFHNYRANRIALKSVKQRSAQKVNQFRASLKSNEPVDSVIYNHQYQREIRIKTEPQESLVSKATSQNQRFNQLLNQVDERALQLSIQIKQERYKKQPKFPPLKGFVQHNYILEQSLDTPTFRNKKAQLSKTLEIENSSTLMDFQLNSHCFPTFNESKEQSPNKDKKILTFPKCIFFCDVKKARNFFQIPSQK